MIRIENLTKLYGNFRALDDLSLDIPEGELFCFLGPNGAGKTTTLRNLDRSSEAVRRPCADRRAGRPPSAGRGKAVDRLHPGHAVPLRPPDGAGVLRFTGDLFGMPRNLVAARARSRSRCSACRSTGRR